MIDWVIDEFLIHSGVTKPDYLKLGRLSFQLRLCPGQLGGLSYLTYSRCFVYDNIINYEVVLADDQFVSANAYAHKDLRVSLRGGANNFSVVTRFDLRAFPQGQLWGSKVFYLEPGFLG